MHLRKKGRYIDVRPETPIPEAGISDQDTPYHCLKTTRKQAGVVVVGLAKCCDHGCWALLRRVHGQPSAFPEQVLL